MTEEYPHIQYDFIEIDPNTGIERSQEFYELMDRRRSCRYFSTQDVPFEIVKNAIKTAGTSPSGAHQQPWSFVVVPRENRELRGKIRDAAEQEEKINYEERMTEEWLEALAPLGTDWRKPFLEEAPYLIIVFRQRYGLREDGSKRKHYYTSESVGISVGFLLSALHNAGLATLTHTPSPMNFLKKILDRPENEIPYVVIPVGYAAEDATVPDLERKDLDEILTIKD